jgi:hypothetical protein
MEEGMTSIDKGDLFRDHRVKAALNSPDRSLEKKLKFATISTVDGGKPFSRPGGREIDRFDAVLTKYYQTPERGVSKPFKDEHGSF